MLPKYLTAQSKMISLSREQLILISKDAKFWKQLKEYYFKILHNWTSELHFIQALL
jgi:hypothetical protein